MNYNYYKNCIVPQCKSTTAKTPNKLFIQVPKNKEKRTKWLQLARRDPNVSSTSRMYFCEDHFDLPNDMQNYTEYYIMGSVSRICMEPGCYPSKFECQPDRRKRTCSSSEQSYILKKQRMTIIEKCINQSVQSSTDSTSGTGLIPETTFDTTLGSTSGTDLIPETTFDTTPGSTSGTDLIPETTFDTTPGSTSGTDLIPENTSDTAPELPKIENLQALETADKSVQVLMKPKRRSKATQTNIKLVDKAASPLKSSQTSVSTSPFKVKYFKSSPSGSGISKISKKLFIDGEQSDSDISLYAPTVTHTESSPSTHSLQIKSSSDCSEVVEGIPKLKLTDAVQCTIKAIMNKPRFYIGVPKNCYFLINIITKETSIPLHHLLLCLKKIRLDTKFQELADEFSITPSYVGKIFFKNIPIIASGMRPFIVKLDREKIKRTLPMAFRHKYHNVSCIIDCLEIEIQKPSKAIHQALTWSEYKKANTIKYLISCTPNGLVNYISPGFGGRTTDTCLVETVEFAQCLEKGMCVMADRGFKHIEQYLQKSGAQLVRPPSVQTGVKLSKDEAKQTKQIASLRIHVERVIRRLREFSMLRLHSCININFIKVLDDIITIACGLINLQDSLIK